MTAVDQLQVFYKGELRKLEDLSATALREIYDKHKEGCTSAELKLALGSEDPIPDELFLLQTLRRVDRLLIAHDWAEEVGPLDGW